MADATCSIDGCDNRVNARGWCKAHYYRWSRYGDPTFFPPRPSVMEQFWARVQKSEDGCWLWVGSIDPVGGYGKFNGLGRKVGAHVAAYRLLVGEIPAGLEIDHLCRVRACVNPGHLEAVTHMENVRRSPRTQAQMARTRCPRGHAYDEANTYVSKRGERACRACRRMSTTERRAALRAA